MKITHLKECTRQSCLALTHLSQGLAPPIFTVAPLWYFSGCFSLAFLEGRCPSLSPAVISLHLDSTTWNPSAPFNRAAFSSSISSRSRWRYSTIHFFFFFFSSTTICLSASFWTFSSTFLLVFWATCSARRNFATSSSWTRSRYSSWCLHCISCCCFSRISVSSCEISEWVGEDIMIQKQEQKTSFFVYILLT